MASVAGTARSPVGLEPACTETEKEYHRCLWKVGVVDGGLSMVAIVVHGARGSLVCGERKKKYTADFGAVDAVWGPLLTDWITFQCL